MRHALVEGVTPASAALARLLVTEGVRVRLAGVAPPGEPRLDASAVEELWGVGVEVDLDADLDADPGAPDVAYLDVWTPEIAPRVRLLRERGARVTTLAELLLVRAPCPAVGVTGTAGKSTTAAFTAQLLRTAGFTVWASTTGRLGNLWPTVELLEALPRMGPGDRLVLELTSSHLAFMERSPEVAVVTCFWPDHLELHGSLAAYRRAKETIVRAQREGDRLVLPADDPAVEPFAALTPARLVQAVALRGNDVVACWEGREVVVGPVAELPVRGRLIGNALLAVAAALAAGAAPEALVGTLGTLRVPAHRQRVVGAGAGVEIVDDGLAATPGKVRAALETYPDRSVVLVAGGLVELAGAPVHASAEERAELHRAGEEVRRAARAVVLFGAAAEQLEPLLAGVDVERVTTLDEALERALELAGGRGTILFSPMFPLPLADRERFAELAARCAP
jgi:UDP-N-acetylmuramoylalanine--D-glutamate ligase